MPSSWSWPNKIRFQSHLGTKAILCSLITMLSANGMNIVPISFVWMIWPAVMIKLILLAQMLVKRCRLLHKCRDIYVSKNQEELKRNIIRRPCYFLTIKMVLMGPSTKNLGSKSSLPFALLSKAWWAWFGVALELLCLPPWYPLRDSFLRDCWVFLFGFLLDNK